jgi:hypothetical protein
MVNLNLSLDWIQTAFSPINEQDRLIGAQTTPYPWQVLGARKPTGGARRLGREIIDWSGGRLIHN